MSIIVFCVIYFQIAPTLPLLLYSYSFYFLLVFYSFRFPFVGLWYFYFDKTNLLFVNLMIDFLRILVDYSQFPDAPYDLYRPSIFIDFSIIILLINITSPRAQ